jgi:hypothetical protein
MPAPGQANGPGGAKEQDPNDQFGPGPKEDTRSVNPSPSDAPARVEFRAGTFGGGK